MTTFQSTIVALDCLLTGSPPNKAEQTLRNQPRKLTAEDWIAFMNEPYYLSDSGYSRLIMQEKEGKLTLGLDAVSRKEVKDCWLDALPTVAMVEAALNEAWGGGWDLPRRVERAVLNSGAGIKPQ